MGTGYIRNEALATQAAIAELQTVQQAAVDRYLRLMTAQSVAVLSTGVASVATNFGANVSGFAKATPGNVHAVSGFNINAAVRYLQLFEDLDGPAAAQVPKFSFIIPAGSATAPATLILGNDFFTAVGVYFATGISWGFSTTHATYTAATATDHGIAIIYV